MRFNEYRPGMQLELGPIVVDEEECIAFARNYDDQWFHTDKEAAEEGPWGGLIASGFFTAALAIKLVSKELLQDSGAYVSPGMKYLRWVQPVRPGDALRLQLSVLDVRVSSSKPWLGIVEWQWVFVNQDDEQVLDLEVTTMFRLQEETAFA